MPRISVVLKATLLAVTMVTATACTRSANRLVVRNESGSSVGVTVKVGHYGDRSAEGTWTFSLRDGEYRTLSFKVASDADAYISVRRRDGTVMRRHARYFTPGVRSTATVKIGPTGMTEE